MSPLVVYAVVIMAAFAAADDADDDLIDCYDEKGSLLPVLDKVDLLNCKVWCPPGCPNGCVGHNLCECGEGYKDSRTAAEVESKAPARCEPVCADACVNGDCVQPDTCACWDGYMADPDSPNVCLD